jgi:hypothetical protein
MTKSYFSRHHCDSKNDPEISDVLEYWLKAQCKYAKRVKGDTAFGWHYRERTCIGFLAAGVWLMGDVALEEFGSNKRNKEKKASYGRCDLWMRLGGNRAFFIEARHLRSLISRSQRSRLKAGIEKKLDAAEYEVGRVYCQKKLRRAFLFITPYFPAGHQSQRDEALSEWLKAITSVEHHAIAWLFPKRGLRCPRFPGIVVLVRKAI